MAFIRKVKTGSGATAVQIACKSYGRIVSIEHLGSAHTDKELSILLSLAEDRLHAGQQLLFPAPATALKVRIKQTFSSLLFKVLKEQYDCLGFTRLNDEYFAYLSLARIVEPTSKLDSLRVLFDLGVRNLSRGRVYRCLQKVIEKDYRSTISRLCFHQAAGYGLSLVLYDVTSLYFEVQEEDNYRRSGLSKERRLEPQIIVGLLADQSGFPLGIHRTRFKTPGGFFDKQNEAVVTS